MKMNGRSMQSPSSAKRAMIDKDEDNENEKEQEGGGEGRAGGGGSNGYGLGDSGRVHRHHLEIKQLCIKCLISFSKSNPLNQNLLFAELPLFTSLMEQGGRDLPPSRACASVRVCECVSVRACT